MTITLNTVLSILNQIVDILLAQIRKNFPNFASYKSAVLDRSNPVHYFGL